MNEHGETFDPYHKWLGIAPSQQPPHHYRLLGIEPFEEDAEVIAAAADRQMAHVRTFQAGPHAAWCQRILNELAAARVCLLDPERKRQYDAMLRDRLATELQGTETPPGGTAAAAPPAELGTAAILPTWIRLVPAALRYLRLECQWRWLQYSRLPPLYWQIGWMRYQAGRHSSGMASVAPLPLETLPEPGRLRGRHGRSLWRTLGRLWRVGREHRRRMVALQNLGREAFAAEGPACACPTLVGSSRSTFTRSSELRSELDRLDQVPPGHLLSPRRLAWLMMVGVGGLAMLFWSWIRPW